MSSSRSRRPRQRPLPRGQSVYTPDARPARRSVERASARPLAFLYQLPAWLPPLLAVALLIAGLAVRGPAGAVALAAMAAVLAWLAFVSWPQASGGARLGRVLAIAAVLALAGWQASR